MPKKFEKINGNIEIIEKFKRNNYYMYKCKCLLCEKEFDALAAYIRKYNRYGCQLCKDEKMEKERIEKKKNNYVGKKIGTLEIIDIYKKEDHFMAKYRCECGNESRGILSAIISGRIKRCTHQREDCLENGIKIMEYARKENTMILSHYQKISKNNTTGIKGVSMCNNGKYRAYIYFKRKQIHLGMFDNIEEAKQAREKAEKEIYGNFEEWYKENYPNEYNNIKDILKKQKNKK